MVVYQHTNNKYQGGFVLETLAWKSGWRHATLEFLIKEIDTEMDLSRSAITNRAIAAAKDVPDWRVVKDDLAFVKKLDIPIATSMQAKPSDEAIEALKDIRPKILSDLNGQLERLQTAYMIQLLWVNYYNALKNQALKVGILKNKTKDLNGPEMVKRLVQILLLNRESDATIIEAIKKALLEWEE